MNNYILVEWPEIQDFMEHSRYGECYSANSVDESEATGVWFVPKDLYEEIKIDKLYPIETDISLGHLKITSNYIELNGIKYIRDIYSKLKKGSEVILYSEDKGYWITKCIACVSGFPPIFEDKSTLLESEIIGIRND